MTCDSCVLKDFLRFVPKDEVVTGEVSETDAACMVAGAINGSGRGTPRIASRNFFTGWSSRAWASNGPRLLDQLAPLVTFLLEQRGAVPHGVSRGNRHEQLMG
jgi:hypothetical protein